MSGQASIIIIVGLVAASLILWVVNTYTQYSTKTRVITSTEVDKISSYIDIIKSFSRNALQISAHKSFMFDASRGRTFYCNGPSPPSIRVILHDVEILTNRTFNEYLSKVSFDDPLLELNITPSTCISFDINEQRLNSHNYDEKFNASEFGSEISIKYGDNFLIESNEIKDESIVRNRFWLIYNGFKRWAEETHAFDNICNCLQDQSICGCGNIPCNGDCKSCMPLYYCTKESIIKSIEELDAIFSNEYIECKGEIENCVLNVEDSSCSDTESCGEWVNDECFFSEYDDEDSLCSDSLSYGIASEQATTTTVTQWSCLVSKKTIKYKAKISFVCIDKKYALPVEASP
ncbi:MAG: hypothetical protein QXI58_06935, partial [Candidatus Micrarchaeia archaeon]